MKAVTQKARFRQAVINYAEKLQMAIINCRYFIHPKEIKVGWKLCN